MDQIQAAAVRPSSPPASAVLNAAAAGTTAAVAPLDDWAKLNECVTQMCIDVGMSQIKRMQSLMSDGMSLTGGKTESAGRTTLWSEIARTERQIEEALRLSRMIADDARRNAFAVMHAMMRVPVPAAPTADAAQVKPSRAA